eukprot:6013573-Amphidinium_carterae.1
MLDEKPKTKTNTFASSAPTRAATPVDLTSKQGSEQAAWSRDHKNWQWWNEELQLADLCSSSSSCSSSTSTSI